MSESSCRRTTSDTGIAGLTLGGSVGQLMCYCGATADSLLAVEHVSAEAQLLTVSAGEHPTCSGRCMEAARVLTRRTPARDAAVRTTPIDSTRPTEQAMRDHPSTCARWLSAANTLSVFGMGFVRCQES